MCRNQKFLHIWHVSDVENVSTYVQFMLFCCKIDFVTIYALLSENLFCRDLRTFVWRKIEPKIASVEKNDKYQVWVKWMMMDQSFQSYGLKVNL